MKRTIDGRDPLKGRGGTGMPIWGDAFKHSREGYSDDAVGERIQALVNYLHSLRATPERDTADPTRKEP